MGLMDSLIGAAASAMGSQNNSSNLIMQLIEQAGGIGGLMNKLQQGGLSEALNSWIGNGANEAVSGEQIQNALGSLIAPVAEKLGMNSTQASDLIAQNLPSLINGLTPNGNAADADGFGLDDIARIALQQFMK
ncbi:MAG: YidB family protein [Neisseria sp.]|nr:YidB family protein [Neisseria sp.]